MNNTINIVTSGIPFVVKGYRDSSGTVSDLTLKHAGRSGFLRLSAESLQGLDQAVADAKDAEPIYKELSAPHAATAVEALKTALEKRLREADQPAGQASPDLRAVNYDHENPTDVFIKDGDPDLLVLMRVEVIDEKIITAAPAKVRPPSAAQFRGVVEGLLPLSRYRHRLNLYPGKYEAVLPHDGNIS